MDPINFICFSIRCDIFSATELFHGVCLGWLATSTAPVSCDRRCRFATLYCLTKERKKYNKRAKNTNIRELRAKTFGRWSVDRLQHAGHYNWHTMCMRCKWYTTRKWYTSFDCFTFAHFFFTTNKNEIRERYTNEMCFIMSYFYGACLQ